MYRVKLNQMDIYIYIYHWLSIGCIRGFITLFSLALCIFLKNHNIKKEQLYFNPTLTIQLTEEKDNCIECILFKGPTEIRIGPVTRNMDFGDEDLCLFLTSDTD